MSRKPFDFSPTTFMVDYIALRIAVDLVIRLEVGVAFVNVLTWQNVRAFVCVQTIRKFADIAADK